MILTRDELTLALQALWDLELRLPNHEGNSEYKENIKVLINKIVKETSIGRLN
jgi:hypothetical protein